MKPGDRLCAWCLRRDIATDSAGRQVTHSPSELELIYRITDQCSGSGTQPVARLSDTAEWRLLMG